MLAAGSLLLTLVTHRCLWQVLGTRDRRASRDRAPELGPVQEMVPARAALDLLDKGEKKRAAIDALLRPGLGNSICLDINERYRRVGTIEFRIARCGQDDLAILHEELDRILLPK